MTARTRITPAPWLAWVIGLVYGPVFITLLIASGVDYDDIAASTDNLLKAVVVTMAILTVAVAVLTTWLGWWRPVLRDDRPAPRWMISIPILFAVAIVAGIDYGRVADLRTSFLAWAAVGTLMVGFCEETVYRGLAVVGFRGGYSEVRVWLFSTLLFVLLHAWNLVAGQGIGATAAQIVFTFALGSPSVRVPARHRHPADPDAAPRGMGLDVVHGPVRRVQERRRPRRPAVVQPRVPPARRDDRAVHHRREEAVPPRRHRHDRLAAARLDAPGGSTGAAERSTADPSGGRVGRAADPRAERVERVGQDVVVRPQALTLTVDDTCVPQDLEVVRDGRLAHVEERDELADADLARVLSQHVDQLQADRVAEGLGDRRHPLGLHPLDVGVHDRLTTGFTGRALVFGGELEID